MARHICQMGSALFNPAPDASWTHSKEGIPLRFNVVSYSGFVGLMGVMTYSWITNMESNEGLNAMPVTVDRVVAAKVALNLLLTAGISAGYFVAIGLAKNEVALIPLGLLVAVKAHLFDPFLICR